VAYTEATAELATRHVREGHQRVQKLEQNIARAQAKGHSTIHAEAALRTMLATLDLMEDHEREIRDALARRRSPG
jgi:hypothetical protein